MTHHPAKFSAPIMGKLSELLWAEFDRSTDKTFHVLDPMAGTGRVHDLLPPDLDDHGRIAMTWGIELEPEWANLRPGTLAGDARQAREILYRAGMPTWFSAVVTSPPYANRLADSYDGRDGSRRNTYRISLGRPLTKGSAAGLHWNRGYQETMAEVWAEVAEMTDYLLVNVSNFYRGGIEQHVALWTVMELRKHGFTLEQAHRIDTRRYKNTPAKSAQRADCEYVLEMRRP